MSPPRPLIVYMLTTSLTHELLAVRAEAQCLDLLAFAAQNNSQVINWCGVALAWDRLVEIDVACLAEDQLRVVAGGVAGRRRVL